MEHTDFFKFPWENGETPYYSDSGVDWYLDKKSTKYLHEETINGTPGINNMFCFITKNDDDINRVIIDDNQNIIYVTKSLESLLYKIDFLKVALND